MWEGGNRGEGEGGEENEENGKKKKNGKKGEEKTRAGITRCSGSSLAM